MRTGTSRELVPALQGLLTLPAAVSAAPPALLDGNDSCLNMDTAGNLRVSVLGPTGGVQVVNVNGVADSLGNAGTVTTPGATTAIVTLAAVPTGVYDVACIAGYGAVGDVPNNMKFFVGATAISILAVTPGANTTGLLTRFPRLTITGPANLTVQSIIAGAAGCVYYASITATRVS